MATVPSTGVLAAIALLCMHLVATPVQADSAQDMKQGSALLFPAAASGAEPIPFELALPLSRLKKLKAADTQAFAARLTLKDGTELPLKVSPRGKSRRKVPGAPGPDDRKLYPDTTTDPVHRAAWSSPRQQKQPPFVPTVVHQRYW